MYVSSILCLCSRFAGFGSITSPSLDNVGLVADVSVLSVDILLK